MEHELIPAGEIHAPHNWVVADEAARLALVVTETDLGKYCWQRDNESQWFLIAHDPATWQPMETTVAWGDITGKPDLIEEGDSRLTDPRTPTGGAGGVLSGSFPNPGFAVDMATQSEVDTQVTLLYTALDELDEAKVDAVAGKGLSTEDYTSAEKTKLAGIATGATANSSDAHLLDRANHTGTQLAATISDFAATVRATVITGLSTATNAAITAADTVLVALGKLQAQITGHTGASSGAHAATAISNTPAGNIAATTVQAAINELDTEKAAVSAVREKLTANRTYYVRTDGSDSNDGLTNTSGGAFLTIQKAVDTAAGLDLGIYDVTIFIGAGTWTAATTLKTMAGAGKVLIRGINADLSSTVISTTSASCFSGTYVGRYEFEYMKLQTTTSGRCIHVTGGGAVARVNNINFGPAAQSHMNASAGAYLDCIAVAYTISGGAPIHLESYDCGNARVSSSTVTLTGTPAFSVAFAAAGRVSSILFVSTTFSGSATGSRYSADTNSSILTVGAGESYLPGNAAGTKTNGGQYT